MELRMGRTNIPLRSIRCFFRGEVVVGNEQHKKKREKEKERKGKHKGEAYPFFNFFFQFWCLVPLLLLLLCFVLLLSFQILHISLVFAMILFLYFAHVTLFPFAFFLWELVCLFVFPRAAANKLSIPPLLHPNSVNYDVLIFIF